ncbi:MAG: EamA family transporter [Bdellovibrionaceae bacterium]|nr:EamA family transporter [Pseudobdellovibrionaceae bacterium]
MFPTDDWRIFALGAALFAALTAIFGKLGVVGVNSNLATWIRCLIILGVLALILSYRGEWTGLTSLSSKTWWFLLLSGLATGASWLCYYRALQLGPVSKVAPVDKLSVAFAILLAVIFLGERPDLKTWLGGALILAGSLVLVL